MAQTGFTPLQIYSSPTTTNVPLAANLAAGELAINTADGKLFYKDSSGVVQVIGTKGGVGSSTTTQVLYNSSGLVVGSANLTFDGTTLTTNTLGAFTLAGTVSGGGNQINNVIIGAVTPLAGSFTTLTTSSTVTLSGGTANGVAYLDGSKVLTSGSALVFDGTKLGIGRTPTFTLDMQSANDNIVRARPAATFGAGFFGSVPNTDTTMFALADRRLTLGGTAGETVSLYTNYLPLTFDLGTEQMRLTSTGLGIGTASPSAKLDVKGGATISTVAGWNTLANSMFELANPAVRFGIGYDSSDQVLLQGFDTANTARNIGMQVYGGNVGIGTASPGYRLDLLSTASAQLRLQNTDATSYASMLFTGTGRSFSMGVGNASETGIQVANQFYIYDNTAGQTRLRLDSSGNFGLGVTPAAWISNRRVLAIGGQAVATVNYAAAIAEDAYNMYFTSGATPTYQVNGPAALVDFNNTTSGGFAWKIAPSGTAGAAIAFTQAMTLDASGNLLVGSGPARGNMDVSSGISGSVVTTALHLGYSPADFYGSRIVNTSNPGATAAGLFKIQQGTTAAWRDDLVIDNNGNLLVGTSAFANSNTNSAILQASSGTCAFIIQHDTGNASGNAYEVFNYNGSAIGSVAQLGTTGVLYNTTSDYRLKTVIGPVADAGTRIDSLQPVEYEWKADGARTRGFLAHQFQEVYAGSVTGEKDAVDEDGKPKYQAMQASSSEVIADLVAEIQSLRKRLAAAGI